MKLVDMSYTPAEIADAVSDGEVSSDDGGPKYPYELTICLDDDGLAKLGITDMPAAGAKMMMHATVTVVRTEARQTQEGVDKEVKFQITAMALEPAAPSTPEGRMFPSMISN